MKTISTTSVLALPGLIWSRRVIHSVGLALVALLVITVCNHKLDGLRLDLQHSPTAHATAADVTRQLDCLTKNIYWEAAGEPFEGKVGVAQVTLNRVASGKFASTVCGVVYQKNVFYEKAVCQFSWFCEGNHRTRPINMQAWAESEAVAKKVLLEKFRLPGLQQALFYHATHVNPAWKLPKIAEIGNHVFYGDGV